MENELNPNDQNNKEGTCQVTKKTVDFQDDAQITKQEPQKDTVVADEQKKTPEAPEAVSKVEGQE